MKDGQRDIWTEGIKCIMGSSKKSLLDFSDALANNNPNKDIKDVFGSIKGRIHNDISQATLSLGILMENLKVKANIEFIEANDKESPWVSESKNIINYASDSLLKFIGAMSKKDKDIDAISNKIKNDLKRSTMNICVLFSTFLNGGDISSFQDNITRRENGKPKKNF